jgi:hypothetical protein
VYRAADTKLGRDVAIKVLPPEVARDPERRAPFQREAQPLASLKHPHVWPPSTASKRRPPAGGGAVPGTGKVKDVHESRRVSMTRVAPVVLTSLVVLGTSLQPALAHDPRTTAKKLSQGIEIEGVGRLDFDYRALHFNPEMFERARNTPEFMGFLNQQVWGRMGRATLGFALVSGDVRLAPGEYDFGVNMTPDEAFSVVLWQGDDKAILPLEVERRPEQIPYLTMALLATAEPDTLLLEARCGPYRGTVRLQTPALAADHTHEHPQ